MPSLTILKPGLLTTVQDSGRQGMGRYGMPVSGAMDVFALRLANRLVGNADTAPALEITAIGPEIRFEQRTRFAIGGAHLSPHLDEHPLQVWRSHTAEPRQILAFGSRQQGARCYLSIAGGVSVPLVMGSAATDLDSGIGGVDGKPLHAGQIVPLLEMAVGGDAERQALPEIFNSYSQPFDVRFIPDQSEETGAALEIFTANRYQVTDECNRMGYRLRGKRVPLRSSEKIISDSIPPGTVQIPPDGQPILLLADRQSMGGYARIGCIATADFPKVAQLWSGHSVRFHPVTISEAQELLRWQESVLQRAVRFV